MFSIPSFAGCLSNVSIESNNINLSSSEEIERVQVSICPSYVSSLLEYVMVARIHYILNAKLLL